MIKVFLVEDEFAIREGIKRSVNWEANGFTLAGEAGDGEVAYPKILKTRPDILLTDIRMPFMDGLELAALVKKELPDIKIIVLSGYDDFNYAKKAISIGVEEYILKPVSGENLMNELEKVAESIKDRKREEEIRLKYMKDREEIRILERQKFIHDMIDGKLSVQESIRIGSELGVDITSAYYNVVLVQIFAKNPGSEQADVYSGTTEEIYKKLKELFENSKNSYLYEQVGDVLCFLGKAESVEEMNKNVVIGMERIRNLMESYEDNLYFISVGKPVERLRDVNISYADASRKFAERYLCTESFVFYDDKMPKSDTLRDRAEEKKEAYAGNESIDIGTIDVGVISQKSVFQFLRNGTLSEIEDFAEDYFSSIGKDALESLMLRRYVSMEALLGCGALMENLGSDKESIKAILSGYTDPIRASESLESTMSYLKDILKITLGYRNSMADKKYTELIAKARKYILENYRNEEMSLLSVAGFVNVSSNHFSTIFRKETGENFIDYVTEVRMDAAKNLLTCTSMKTSEVGFEVGYRDPHYFSYIFKKTQGMSPKEYRRMKKEA